MVLSTLTAPHVASQGRHEAGRKRGTDSQFSTSPFPKRVKTEYTPRKLSGEHTVDPLAGRVVWPKKTHVEEKFDEQVK